MPAVNLSPVFNGWQGFTPSGLPMSGGFLYTYQAGTATPLSSYTTNVGNVTNANPIVLGTDGRPPQEIWLVTTSAYKFVLTDSLLNVICTYDNITGIDNSVPAALSEWVISGLTPSYVSATQFTLAGDQTALFQVGRRVQYTLGSGQSTGSITASVFGALTTVTLVTDSIPLDNTLSAVNYGLLNAAKPSVPTNFKSPITGPSVTTTGAVSVGTTLGVTGATTLGNTLAVTGLATHSAGLTTGNVAQASLTTLDWYEEKTTWTPVLVPAAGTGIVYALQKGIATRIGNRVHFDMYLGISSLGTASGNVYISGLPFTVLNDVTSGITQIGASIGEYGNFTGLTGALMATLLAASDRIYLRQMGAANVATIGVASLTATSYIMISGTYPTA